MRTIIIAEAGVNHNGSIELAKKMIDVAVEAGVDYIKFQTFKANKLVTPQAKKAEYQQKNLKDHDDSQLAMLQKLELDEKAHIELIAYCKKKGIKFLSTGFDEDSINLLDRLGLLLYKIPSGEITNKPYLNHVAKKDKPVILSTGMADLGEIEAAIKVLLSAGLQRGMITVLHCNTEYPTPMEDVNLRAMLTIKEAFKVNIGYSDHTNGIEVPIAAVALGAKVIEKHFTLDKNLPGPDHKASLGPHELVAMVKAIRNIELTLSSDGIKLPSKSEENNLNLIRKSIHTKISIRKGEFFSNDNIIALRPGDGISPMKWDDVIGKKATRDLLEKHKLTPSDFNE